MPDAQISALIPVVRAVLSKAYPELAAAMKAAIPSVCVRHIADVRAEIASAARLSEANALDDLSKVLHALADTLGSEDNLAAVSLTGPAHAVARDGQNFTLGEVMGEYVLLRRNLEREVADKLGRPPTLAESEAQQSGLDGMVALVVNSFHEQRLARQNLEAQALMDFASSLAHEVRNEAAGMMIVLALFEENGGDLAAGSAKSMAAAGRFVKEVKACRQTMDSSIAAMTRLLEAERCQHPLPPHPRDVALRALMEGVARSVARRDGEPERSADPAVSRISVKCPPDLMLSTDPDLLTTILTNLMGNAIKYAPVGPIEFRAVCTGQECRITVADHGPGMEPEDVAKIFNKFHRAGPRKQEGMGLGLYVARRAATLLHGALHVESTPGAGTRFTLVVPWSQPEVRT